MYPDLCLALYLSYNCLVINFQQISNVNSQNVEAMRPAILCSVTTGEYPKDFQQSRMSVPMQQERGPVKKQLYPWEMKGGNRILGGNARPLII